MKVKASLCVIAGLSLRPVSSLFNLSHEGLRKWVLILEEVLKGFKRIERKRREFVAIDETCLKVRGIRVYIWAAIDIATKELLAIKASFRRDEEAFWDFIPEVLEACEGDVCFVVDKGHWYKAVFNFLGLKYIHMKFGKRKRNAMERFFRPLSAHYKPLFAWGEI